MYEDIKSFTNSDANSPFFVQMCGISYCDGSYEMNRPNSAVSVIEYIIKGNGVVTQDDDTFEANEGDIYFLKETRNQHYYSDKDNPWTKIWFNFSGILAQRITECYNLWDVNHIHAPELKPLFFKIREISLSNKDTETVSNEISYVFLELAQKIHAISKNTNIKAGVPEKLKYCLDNKVKYNMSLDEIIAPFYCSKNHAIRVFKNKYGISPYEYIQQKRFSDAKNLLKNTAMSISDIADKLDFYDIQYFSSCFKRRFGITPSEFRKL